jgi:hypothetical protein
MVRGEIVSVAHPLADTQMGSGLRRELAMDRDEIYGDLDRAQAHVGRFLWHWALLEGELRRALRRALNLSDLEVRIIASNVQLRAKIDIIRTVINANGPTEAGQRSDNVLRKIANLLSDPKHDGTRPVWTIRRRW